ncbi:MAG: hypothetical protein PVSMB8_00390 [Vulcanimicrobiaceae bacterium]
MAGAKSARDVLDASRRRAIDLVQKKGLAKTQKLLEAAARDLTKRLDQAVKGPGAESFTAQQRRAALAQVVQVQRDLAKGMQANILNVGEDAANASAEDTIKYLAAADKEFSGIAQPLALDHAAMFDAATQGVRASILKRLASSGEPIEGADDEPHRAKHGILERYGIETIGEFERRLQLGILTGKTWNEMREDITEASPFLQGAPKYWGERIVRTEVMGAYNKGGWESTREGDEQLGDMVKILSATFDNRTGADSYAVHGQIRRPDEAFESWFGLYQHPPNRPNDREVVTPHRISWPIPPYLAWKSDAEIAAAWAREGRKGGPPARPKMTTIPIKDFGKPPRKAAKPVEEVKQEEPKEEVPKKSIEPDELPIAAPEEAPTPKAAPVESAAPEVEQLQAIEPEIEKPKKLTKAEKKAAKDAKLVAAILAVDALPKLPGLSSYLELPPGIGKATKEAPDEFVQYADMKDASDFGELLDVAKTNAKTKKLPVGDVLVVGSAVNHGAVAEQIVALHEGKDPVLIVHKYQGKVFAQAAGANALVAQKIYNDPEKVSATVFDFDAAVKQKAKEAKAAEKAKKEAPAPTTSPPVAEMPPHDRAALIAKGSEKLKAMDADPGKRGAGTLQDDPPATYSRAVQEQPKKLSPEQRESIDKFSHGYDWTIRQYELGKMTREELIKAAKSHGSYEWHGGTPEKHIEQAVKASEHIAEAFKSTVPVAGQTWRGMALNKGQLAKLMVEDDMVMHATSSSSTENAVARNFISTSTEKPHGVLLRLQQKSGMAIKAMSTHASEEEILIARGTRFRITKREMLTNGTVLVDAEEVEENANQLSFKTSALGEWAKSKA